MCLISQVWWTRKGWCTLGSGVPLCSHFCRPWSMMGIRLQSFGIVLTSNTQQVKSDFPFWSTFWSTFEPFWSTHILLVTMSDKDFSEICEANLVNQCGEKPFLYSWAPVICQCCFDWQETSYSIPPTYGQFCSLDCSGVFLNDNSVSTTTESVC